MRRPIMSQKKSNRGSVLSFLVNVWTIVTLVLSLSGAMDIAWWVILGPYMLLLGIALVGALILGVATALDK